MSITTIEGPKMALVALEWHGSYELHPDWQGCGYNNEILELRISLAS